MITFREPRYKICKEKYWIKVSPLFSNEIKVILVNYVLAYTKTFSKQCYLKGIKTRISKIS